MTLELTPETGDMVNAILRRPSSLGDPSRLAALVERSDVVVQRHELRDSTVGIDIDVLRAEGSTVTATATSTWIKPPHGTLVEVDLR